MFKIESYVTPILLSYVDKYVKDFKPADAQVSLWGGGVVLHNLVLKTDVVQQEVPLPFTLVSGRIHELLIQVPWTKIMSEPIVVTIDTIECILNQRPANQQPKAETPSGTTQVVEAPPGYMQALVRRIVSNIAIRIHHLIVKYVQDDIVLSLNVKHLSINSTAANWEPAFADVDTSNPAIRRLIVLDDLTLCLDNTESDGKIRFYQDPLLYRCGVEFRVLAKLVSANTRRASSFNVQMSTTKIGWGVTSAQLLLLLRLLKEKPQAVKETQSSASAEKSTTATPMPTQQPTSNATEPSRRESWSDWAWSWKSNREKEEATMASCPTPFTFSAYLDEISLNIKVLETETNTRKRSRSLLEFTAGFTAVKCWICAPTLLRVKLGIRSIVLKSIGKCTCGHHDLNSIVDEPTVYLSSRQQIGEVWKWPENKEEVEVVQVAEKVTEKKEPRTKTIPEETEAQASGANQPSSVEENVPEVKEIDEPIPSTIFAHRKSRVTAEFNDLIIVEPRMDAFDLKETQFWNTLSPVVYLEFIHERTPPNQFINPYDNAPKDFEYSDWEEQCNIHIRVKPIDFRICMGLVHRLVLIKKIFDEVPPSPIEPMRVLTVEECEALNQNLPQRRISIEVDEFRINVHPWDHSTVEKPVKEALLLQIEMPKGIIVLIAPLYPQRVCSAAGQIPEDSGTLWRGCRLHTTAALNNIKISVCSPFNDLFKPCGRISLRFVSHILLYPEYFEKKRSVQLSYAVKIREVNVSGSAARLHAAAQVLVSLMNERISLALRQTTLAKDALADENLVALDITAEELTGRGFMAKNIRTHIFNLQSLRATVFQSEPNKEMQQAWLFSGPDVPTTSSYARLAIQLCDEIFPGSIDFIGLWTEPTALAIDPLLASWLSYKPSLRPYSDSNSQFAMFRRFSSTQSFNRRQMTPSSSVRGLTRSGTASADVHYKSRSMDSSSEPSEKKETKDSPPAASEKPAEPWWMGKHLLKVHDRLKKILICVEFGLALIYVPTKTATAVGCETVRVAMENHVTSCQTVVVYSLGRWSLYTNNVTKHLWHVINHDGPTYVKDSEGENEKTETSFPWKMLLADMTCYTLEAPDTQRMKSDLSSSLRSQLKGTAMVRGCTILELVSTNIALTVVTKTLQHKMVVKAADNTKQSTKMDKREAKLRYFTTGTDFKPTTFSEFLRGPTRRKKDSATQSVAPGETQESPKGTPIQKVVDGPIVSLGFNLHADTPPVVFRFEYYQVQLVSVSLHCINHVIALLKRNPVDISRRVEVQIVAASRSMMRAEMDDDFMTESDQRSDDRLMTIFQFNDDSADTIKAFFWFQWVISRITSVVTIEKFKLALDVDDVSTSIDLQEHYKQLKIKINSIFIKNFELSEEFTWVPGAFGGRVLDAREPTNPTDEPNFLTVTITGARISTLPESWKEELHPKLLEHQSTSDTMWEVYAVVASLEVVLIPEVLNNVILLNKATSLHKSCSSCNEEDKPTSTFDLPYCYLSAGGLKMLIASKVDKKNIDDTFILTVGKISVNPHPDNPICRRPVSATDTGWSSVMGNLEGRQYELTVKKISLDTAEFRQLAIEQQDESESEIANENPAVKWSKTVVVPNLSPILHPLDIDLLLAPALFISGSLVCGPAVELNLTTDCVVELNIDQLILIKSLKKLLNRAKLQQMIFVDMLNERTCPYLMFFQTPKEEISLGNLNVNPTANQTPKDEISLDDYNKPNTITFASTADSGNETATSYSTFKSTPLKKRISFSSELSAFRSSSATDYLEVFLTTGTFEISLYTMDDGSKQIQSLRKPRLDVLKTAGESLDNSKKEEVEFGKAKTIRHLDYGRTELKDLSTSHLARNTPECVPLLHATFYQPNLYYWKRMSQNNLQVSLFNLWFGLGMGLVEGFWRSPILSTARGELDPVTEIPPALGTMKYTSGTSGDAYFNTSALNQRGTLNLDIERPVLFEISEDNMRRLMLIFKLVETKLAGNASVIEEKPYKPMPNIIRRFFMDYALEVATIRTSQIGVIAAGACLGLDSASLQVFLSSRRDQLAAKGLISAIMISKDAGIYENKLSILHPTHIGIHINFSWEAWQRAEGGASAKKPSTRILLDIDSINIDLAPENLEIVKNILHTLQTLDNTLQLQDRVEDVKSDHDSFDDDIEEYPLKAHFSSSVYCLAEGAAGEHYYRDDLRSGAFKILTGEQMPMAYQVILNKNGISWRYPHPRAITRLVAYPLPNQNKEIDCILEFYCLIINQWEPYIDVKLPVSEPREIILHNRPPEFVFSPIWRFRTVSEIEKPVSYQFKISKYQPTGEPNWLEDIHPIDVCGQSEVSAEQLSGILRVDSYFGPHHTPRSKYSVRFARMDLNVHNGLPQIYKQAVCLEGYYVSKPLMCAHRVLTISAQNANLHYRSNSLAGSVVLFHTLLSSEIVDCSTGTMQNLAGDFKLQVALSFPQNVLEASCLRLCTGKIKLSLHLSRLRTLQVLTSDWQNAFIEYLAESNEQLNIKEIRSQKESVEQATHILEGRVVLWIHNSCSVPLRMGQEDTDEVFPLGPGAKLAYRWRNPAAKKRMRFAIINPTGDWHWSNCVSFSVGESRVRLEDTEFASSAPGAGVFIHAKVKQNGAHRLMRLSGRLVLANMLKLNLYYKVRARVTDSSTWSTISSGELNEESVSRSVIIANNCEMVLKVRFLNHDTGWSGDIPLKECPKENVPWLVKVPSQGDMPYVSVWCRVVRARSDGRIFAAVWPLYVLTSNLTLDTDVLIETDLCGGLTPKDQIPGGVNPTPLIQSALGRGIRTHLLAPGTTSAKHSLSFQYRSVECPVTREAVPLHYGVTDTSVFDKRIPINTIEEVVQEIKEWLKSGRQQGDPEWPHSIVSKHITGHWVPAVLQPRCDVSVRYRAVRVGGGGCSLEVELNPVLLICNAAPISVTLRAHDAAPLCKLDPASIIAPPTIVLKKPFFMSVEKGRETFVSQQMEVCSTDPGRYGSPPPGQVAVDHPALFAIPYHDTVTILSLHYEIKDDINIMGITPAFFFVNNLDQEVSIATTAVPDQTERKKSSIRPKKYQLVQASKSTSVQYTPLCQFRLCNRWIGGEVSELAMYLSVGLPPLANSVPIKLGASPYRRPLTLRNSENKSMPVVITQHKYEGRWIAALSPDPCPQFLINNKTSYRVAIAQPYPPSDDGSNTEVHVMHECAGVDWWCHLNPGTSTHYSSPGYTFGQALPSDQPSPDTWLTFADCQDVETEHVWCPPVAITTGVQRLQLSHGVIVKLLVRPHPHTALVELRDITHIDISAKDIRKRLLFSDRMSIESKTASGIMVKDDNFEKAKDDEDSKKNDETRRKVSLVDPKMVAQKEIQDEKSYVWDRNLQEDLDRVRCMISSIIVEMAVSCDTRPLLAIHVDRTHLSISTINKKVRTTVTVTDVQIDNPQYESGQYDFAVVAATRAEQTEADSWPSVWNMFTEQSAFEIKADRSRVLLKMCQDNWSVLSRNFSELTEIDVRAGPLALYIEDAYIAALADLLKAVLPLRRLVDEDAITMADANALRKPLRLRLLHIQPVDLTLTLHTAVRIYIALDQSPLHLNAFKVQHMFTTTECLAHALTVHYLSAAILSAGWVVGGLELLGAPGALAARVGGARGGVRGIASTTAAALLRSLSACAGSLARNLDLLAGDEEHARRAAAARRRPPSTFVGGLVAGFTNFAINILGAVGGLAHHPLVGVAVGETESSAAALRRSLLGALTKPLSATADLVAYAGHGLLTQTGWDPVPQPRLPLEKQDNSSTGWRRDCVRWAFRLAELSPLTGFEVLLEDAPMQLIITHKFLVFAEIQCERVVEMIDLRHCNIGPFSGGTIELCVAKNRTSKSVESKPLNEDDDLHVSEAAMQRVARYAGLEQGVGAGGTEGCAGERRTLTLVPTPGQGNALHALLLALSHSNAPSHFPLI